MKLKMVVIILKFNNKIIMIKKSTIWNLDINAIFLQSMKKSNKHSTAWKNMSYNEKNHLVCIFLFISCHP